MTRFVRALHLRHNLNVLLRVWLVLTVTAVLCMLVTR